MNEYKQRKEDESVKITMEGGYKKGTRGGRERGREMQSDRQDERGVRGTRNHRLKWKRMDKVMRNNVAAVSNNKP